MGYFADHIHELAPPWFLGPYMRSFLRSVGGVLDEMAAKVFAGRRASNPYAGGARGADGALLECEADVLPWHAGDRGIRLYDTEPELSKRVRLGTWRQLKKRRGSHPGELRNLRTFWLSTATAVLPTIRIVFQTNEGTPSSVWYTLSPAGVLSINRRTVSNWNYDGQATKRTRFWCIIHLPPGYSSAIVYDDGVSVYEGGALYDGVTAVAINDIVAALKEAKAAHSRLAAVIATSLQPWQLATGAGGALAFDPLSVAATLPDGSTSLPVGNWGVVSDPATGLPTRPPWATWIFEDNP